MTKRILGLFTVASLMLFSLSTHAATVIWEPADDTDPTNIVITSFDYGAGITDIAIFDDSDAGLATALLQFDVGSDADVTFFTADDSGDWSISPAESDETATLSDSDNFIVAVSDDDGATWTADLTFERKGSSDTYFLTFDDVNINDTIILTKVQPVPVPAALWLFGSAMVGLVVVGRRKKLSAEEHVV